MVEPDSKPSEYRRRIVDDDLDALMPGLAAISIEGPKAVGKTATALTRASTVYKLDDVGQRQIIEADPARLTRGALPILVDEWQKWPPSWDVVRRAVDANPSPGRFVLTGSASPSGVDIHSGAGRIVPIRMRPLSLAERGFTASVSLRSCSLVPSPTSREPRQPPSTTTSPRYSQAASPA
jgi:predicted AAA+ superfamily ATPase